MLTLKNFSRVLVSYYRRPAKYEAKVVMRQDVDSEGRHVNVPTAVLKTSKGLKKGILVAIGPGIVGWSLCKDSWSPRSYVGPDDFNQQIGMHIALNRALAVQEMGLVEKAEFAAKVPETLKKDYTEMIFRSFRYFKEDVEL